MRSKEQLKELLDNAWLGLGDTSEMKVFNILTQPEERWEDYELEMLSILRNPKYFGFTAKLLFDIDLVPFQVSILRELWRRKFPMLIGVRGLSKSFILALYAVLRAFINQNSKVVVVGAAFRQSKILFEYMEQFWRSGPIFRNLIGSGRHEGPKRDIDRCSFYIGGSEIVAIPLGTGEKIRGLRGNFVLADEFNCAHRDTLVETSDGLKRIEDCAQEDIKVINENGEYETPTNFVITPLTDVYKITTKSGYSFKCSSRHKVKTSKGWKLAKDLLPTDYLVMDNKYIFPTRNIIIDNTILDEKLAWLFGLLISEGTLTNDNMVSIRTTNLKLVKKIKKDFTYLNPKIYSRKKYTDKRGWKCKKSYSINIHNKIFRELLSKFGLDYTTSHNKRIPWSILQSPKSVVSSFLSGLFTGDGSCFLFYDKKMKKNRTGIAYYSVNEKLIDEIQTVLYKFDILTNKQSRKSKISKNLQWMLRANGEYVEKLGKVLNISEYTSIISSAYITRQSINRGVIRVKDKWISRVLYCGHYIQLGTFISIEDARNCIKEFYKNNPNCVKVKSVELLKEKDKLYDFVLPKTHSFYGNCFIQHNSIVKEIFEVVIRGFGSVSAKPHERVKDYARMETLRSLGMLNEANDIQDDMGFGNQTVISGTAGYSFQPLYEYWYRYKQIIESGGDKRKLQEIFLGEIPDNFNWKDYSIIRVPHFLVPDGFLDKTLIAQAKATASHKAIALMEYGAVFAKDSEGFFKRSILEACTCKPIVSTPDGTCSFGASIVGNPSSTYVYGIDPASEANNFSIIILEIMPSHRRIVYSWSVNRQTLRERLKKVGKSEDKNFYSYCARKIRDLMRLFPTTHIAIDSQGGGITILEMLHDIEQLEAGELQLWPYIRYDDNDPLWWEKKDKPTDKYGGSHIMHMINFADAKFNSEANHGLRADFENHSLVFPVFDTVAMADALAQDKIIGREYDTLEDCILEIEQLKDELTTIIYDKTTTGRDKWDTPEIKMPGGKKGRLRKDRYSALIMANMVARTLTQIHAKPIEASVGTYVGASNIKRDGDLYIAPANLRDKISKSYAYRGVIR